ncbi:hypothetical protein [uncultured Roseobacter sp.]|uniref:hypothetical protein n=1 Tax=uncultured Roseobacter sp. TaxID=114847 RepID=UPI00262E962E|nr:hypothetical protein [uncultured Roseobacter sp.]
MSGLFPASLGLYRTNPLPHLLRVMHDHLRALTCNGGNQIVAAARFEQFAGRVVSPTVNVVALRPDLLTNVPNGL